MVLNDCAYYENAPKKLKRNPGETNKNEIRILEYIERKSAETILITITNEVQTYAHQHTYEYMNAEHIRFVTTIVYF